MQIISGYPLTLFFTFLFIAITAPDCSSSRYPCFDYTIDNITKGFPGNSTSPSISGDGRYVAFESTTDITEKNPGGTYQVFIYDTRTGEYSQITDDENLGSVAPSISGDGTQVAFVSAANIKGNNPDALNLIYLYDLKSGGITQVTKEGNSFEPSLNEDGSLVAFTSNRNTSTNTSEIFVFDSLSGTTNQITDSARGISIHPQISESGRFIVYQSSTTAGGDKPEIVSNIFLYDTVSEETTQVSESHDEIGSISPSISSDGRFITFQADIDLNSDNPHKNFNIYLYDKEDKKLSQITDEPRAGNAGATINSDGSAIAFQSSGNFTNKNPDRNLEIFLYITYIEDSVQVTDTGSNIQNTGAVISADSTHVAFVYDNTSEAENPEQKSDIYLVSYNLENCNKDISIPGTSHDIIDWLILAGAAVLTVLLLGKFKRKRNAA